MQANLSHSLFPWNATQDNVNLMQMLCDRTKMTSLPCFPLTVHAKRNQAFACFLPLHPHMNSVLLCRVLIKSERWWVEGSESWWEEMQEKLC